MTSRTLIADDLTGALDAGVQGAGLLGGRVLCVWNPDAAEDPGEDGLLVVDSETRNLAPDAARTRLSAWTRRLQDIGRSVDFMKIDSTLRGHIASELKLLLSTWPRGALFCPALPKQGRTVRDGCLYVHGRVLEETDMASDPLAPVGMSRITELLASAGLPVLQLAAPDPALRMPPGPVLVIADADTDAQLTQWACFAREHRLLPVGSAGLAAAWLAADHGSPGELPLPPGPVALLCATPAEATRHQLDALSSDPSIPVLTLRPDRALLLSDETDVHRADVLHRLARQAQDALTQGRHVLIDVAGRASRRHMAETEGDAAQTRQHARRILSALAVFVPYVNGAGTRILLGGDTSRALLDRSGASALEIRGQVRPQMPLAVVRGGIWDGQSVATKAGGFGDPDLLCRLLRNAGAHGGVPSESRPTPTA